MTRTTSTKYISQFSYIRVLAALAVVALHTIYTAKSIYGQFSSPGEALVSSVIYRNLMWAVPCFLMVTGALLLDKDRKISSSRLLGYIRRMLLAIVFFWLVFAAIDFHTEGASSVMKHWLSAAVQCRSWSDYMWSHMWYLYLMTGLYLMLPFYRMIVRSASRRQLWYLTSLLIAFTSFAPVAEIFGYEIGFYIPTSVIYPAYLFLGYLLWKENLPAFEAFILLAACTAGLVWLTLHASSIPYDIDHMMKYASPLVVGQSAAIFSLISRIQSPADDIIRSIDRCTLGIYLIHMIGIDIAMVKYGFDPFMYGPYGFIGLIILLFITSYSITWIIRRIPRLHLL